MKQLILVFAAALIIFQWFSTTNSSRDVHVEGSEYSQRQSSDRIIVSLYENSRSDVQVEGEGRVVRILADDNDGSRHQKFILKLASGHTLLVAHNIDLAPRIDSLAQGDLVGFFGEYEWNNRGGVIHWTHHDPRGRHVGGWLKHRGRIYQ